jgi:bifunctional non-homologous end joining protein LigD
MRSMSRSCWWSILIPANQPTWPTAAASRSRRASCSSRTDCESRSRRPGSSGLHLFSGLAPGATFAATRAYARALAQHLVAADPTGVTDQFPFSERIGKVLVDWRQNERSRSMIAPYSLRGTPWPLVSTPISWEEVAVVASGGDGRPLLFTPDAVRGRVDAAGDLFADSLDRRGRLDSLHAFESTSL